MVLKPVIFHRKINISCVDFNQIETSSAVLHHSDDNIFEQQMAWMRVRMEKWNQKEKKMWSSLWTLVTFDVR